MHWGMIRGGVCAMEDGKGGGRARGGVLTALQAANSFTWGLNVQSNLSTNCPSAFSQCWGVCGSLLSKWTSSTYGEKEEKTQGNSWAFSGADGGNSDPPPKAATGKATHSLGADPKDLFLLLLAASPCWAHRAIFSPGPCRHPLPLSCNRDAKQGGLLSKNQACTDSLSTVFQDIKQEETLRSTVNIAFKMFPKCHCPVAQPFKHTKPLIPLDQGSSPCVIWGWALIPE